MRAEYRITAEGFGNVMCLARLPRNCEVEVEQLLSDAYEPLIVEHVQGLVEDADERPVVGPYQEVW